MVRYGTITKQYKYTKTVSQNTASSKTKLSSNSTVTKQYNCWVFPFRVGKVSLSFRSHNWTVQVEWTSRTGLAEQAEGGRQNRTGGLGEAEGDRQNRKVRTGQADKTGRWRYTEQDIQNGTGRTGNQNRTSRIRPAKRDRQNVTGRMWQAEQDW
jgi:hypothetical protein